MDKLVKMSIEEQAGFCDQVIYSSVKRGKNDFIDKQVLDTEAIVDKQYMKWNTSSVGGFAHIAIHYPDTVIQEKAKKLLSDYIAWYNEYGVMQRDECVCS